MDETNVVRVHNRGGPSGSLWSIQREEQLKKLWLTDLSRAQIAEALGVSKSAVIGKSDRLRLGPRDHIASFPLPVRQGKKHSCKQKFQPVSWTSEEIESLRALWSACVRREDIAAQLGRTISSVRSKVSELHLRRAYNRGKQLRTKTKTKPQSIRPAPVIEAYFGAAKSIIDLSYGECRFAVSTDEEGRHLFCGAPVICLGSWCAEHRAVAFTPRRVLAMSEVAA